MLPGHHTGRLVRDCGERRLLAEDLAGQQAVVQPAEHASRRTGPAAMSVALSALPRPWRGFRVEKRVIIIPPPAVDPLPADQVSAWPAFKHDFEGSGDRPRDCHACGSPRMFTADRVRQCASCGWSCSFGPCQTCTQAKQSNRTSSPVSLP
jgi:hypothetical protein